MGPCGCRFKRRDVVARGGVGGGWALVGAKSLYLRKRRIDMPTLYLTEEYALVRRDSEDCLLVQIPEKKGEGGAVVSPACKKRIPLHKVDDVVVMGEITMTTSAISLLMEKQIEIHFLNQYGQFKGKLSPPLSKNSLLRMAQHRAHTDLDKRC